MDPENAIELRNVCKTYKTKIRRDRHKVTMENKVLDNISLTIKKGEVIGIIGINGSGKSTLLSIISRIMEPDTGSIEFSGRIASILELGMGFHPDMTGRENIYLKGEMYGFSKNDIDSRIDRIIQYSGLDTYIDHPVRTYSSGMNGRLAFSIMVNVESDIMLVDEVLSVGDEFFEIKAREHFKKVATSGKTIVIVSHQIRTIESMCTRVIWIENGKIRKDGPPPDVCREYENSLYESPEVVENLAQSGSAEAQYKLALMYKNGVHFNSDSRKYEEWLKKAVIQGHKKARMEYADSLYEAGKIDDAIKIYQSVANQGDYLAKVKVSSLNSSTKSKTQNLISIYENNLTPGNGLEEYRFAELLRNTALTQADLERAFSMYLTSASDGYPNAMYQVGIMYRDGTGVSRDISKMEEYLTKAADKSFLPSIKLLIEIYDEGKILPKNDNKVFNLTKKAAHLGDSASIYKLANLYQDGRGTEINIPESDKWYNIFSDMHLFWYKVWAIDYLKISSNNKEEIGTILNENSICS